MAKRRIRKINIIENDIYADWALSRDILEDIASKLTGEISSKIELLVSNLIEQTFRSNEDLPQFDIYNSYISIMKFYENFDSANSFRNSFREGLYEAFLDPLVVDENIIYEIFTNSYNLVFDEFLNQNSINDSYIEFEPNTVLQETFEMLSKEDLHNIFVENRGNFTNNHNTYINKLNLYVKKTIDDYFTNLKEAEIYQLRKNIFETELLLKDIGEIFKDISEKCKINQESFDNPIIKGIIEAIDIKIDSFTEGWNYFFEEIPEKFNQNFIDDVKKDELVLNICNFITKSLYTHISSDISELLKLSENEDFFVEFFNSFNKSMQNLNTFVSKKLLSFSRDTIFYELSTFDEILHYSVSALRNEEDAYITEFVQMMDECVENIKILLSKNNIYRIEPLPHTPFNAKEHEILMAESLEGFNKGEIIKFVNSGYKKGDEVLLRANVIAAK